MNKTVGEIIAIVFKATGHRLTGHAVRNTIKNKLVLGKEYERRGKAMFVVSGEGVIKIVNHYKFKYNK